MARMTIAAFYDSEAAARQAADALARQLGLERARVQVHAAPGGARDEGEDGLLEWLARIWRPEAERLSPEERALIGEGLRRGGAVLSTEIQEGDRQRATEVLEACGAVDLETRAIEWRGAGEEGAAPGSAPGGARVRSYCWDAPTMGAPTGPTGPPRVQRGPERRRIRRSRG